MIRSRAALAGGLALVLGASGRAQPMARDLPSLELSVKESDAVVVGKVEEVAAVGVEKGPSSGAWPDSTIWRITVRTTETLKGPAVRQIAFDTTRYVPGRATRFEDWKRDGTPLLLFLTRIAATGETAATGSAGGAGASEISRYALRKGLEADTALDLRTPVKAWAFSLGADLTLIRGAGPILNRVRAIVRRPASSAEVVDRSYDHHFLNVPQRLPRTLQESDERGRYFRVEVPVDDALLRRALAWTESKDPMERIEGIRALRHFRSEATVRLLTRLLDDPYRATVEEGDDPHIVRVAAKRMLQKWRDGYWALWFPLIHPMDLTRRPY